MFQLQDQKVLLAKYFSKYIPYIQVYHNSTSIQKIILIDDYHATIRFRMRRY